MYRYLVLLLLAGTATAHQLTPTYPKLEMSFVPGVVQARMQLFNKRTDINYYEFQVFDKDWNSIPFAVNGKIQRVEYLETKNVDIYIQNENKDRATYICAKSKILAAEVEKVTSVSSRICSKIK